MSQVAVPTLAYMSRTSSPNDCAVLFAGGVYYAEDYGSSYKDRAKVFDAHIDQIADTMRRLGVTILHFNNTNWKSDQTVWAYNRLAERIPGLTGILSVQYYPYTGGHGNILWVKNAKGDPIPVISARYAIWEHHSMIENEGTPAVVSTYINAAQHDGPITSDAYLDWTTVHAWSYFKQADTSVNFQAEEVDQKLGDTPGVERGVDPVKWCVDRLSSDVKVVTPDELIWRVRLTLKTRETLNALARDLAAERYQPARIVQKLGAYRVRLVKLPLSTDDERRKAFEELQAIRYGR
jgi:hypothetical protein